LFIFLLVRKFERKAMTQKTQSIDSQVVALTMTQLSVISASLSAMRAQIANDKHASQRARTEAVNLIRNIETVIEKALSN
jgi:hypothetical protein